MVVVLRVWAYMPQCTCMCRGQKTMWGSRLFSFTFVDSKDWSQAFRTITFTCWATSPVFGSRLSLKLDSSYTSPSTFQLYLDYCWNSLLSGSDCYIIWLLRDSCREEEEREAWPDLKWDRVYLQWESVRKAKMPREEDGMRLPIGVKTISIVHKGSWQVASIVHKGSWEV